MMTDAVYFKWIESYFQQCGTHTDLWLSYAMALKWEFISQEGY